MQSAASIGNTPDAIIKGMLLALLSWSALTFADTMLKYSGQVLPVFTMGFWNALFGTITLLIIAYWQGGIRKNLTSRQPRLQAIRSFLILIDFLLFTYAIIHMPLTKVYVILFIAPFVTALLTPFLLKEKTAGTQWLVIIAGFSGALITLRPGFIPLELPALCMLVVVFAHVLTNTASRKIGEDEPWLVFFFYPVLLLLICCGAVLLVAGGFVLPDPRFLALLAVSGIVAAIANCYLAQAFVLAPANIVAPFLYCQLVWAVIFDYTLFSEVPDMWNIAGAAIIVGSGLWLLHWENRKSGGKNG